MGVAGVATEPGELGGVWVDRYSLRYIIKLIRVHLQILLERNQLHLLFELFVKRGVLLIHELFLLK